MNKLQTLTAATEPPVARMLHAMGRRQGVPVFGTFELTSGCNFNCGMCYIHSPGAVCGAAGELTAAQWLEVGRQAANAGTVFVLLTGGEPLLRPDFAVIYTGLKKLGLAISINTNGSLLTGETAALLEKNPPMRLNISLYADSREGYLRHCGADAFPLVADNIRRMKAAGVSVKLNVAFGKDNADRYRELAALVEELGLHCQATAYQYPPVRRASPAAAAERLSPEQAGSLRVRWDRLRGREEQLRLSAGLLSGPRAPECGEAALPAEGVRCRAGHTSYWVDSRGNMLMCGMIPLSAGLVPELGFASCWQNVKALIKTVLLPEQCGRCALRPVCSVCPAVCYAETGHFTEPPPYLCAMSRRIARELEQMEKGELKDENK